MGFYNLVSLAEEMRDRAKPRILIGGEGRLFEKREEILVAVLLGKGSLKSCTCGLQDLPMKLAKCKRHCLLMN